MPVEMLGYVDFPPIGKQPYRLTLGPYGFFWLELHGEPNIPGNRQPANWHRRRLWRIPGSACWRAPGDIGWNPCCCRSICRSKDGLAERRGASAPPESPTGCCSRIRTRSWRWWKSSTKKESRIHTFFRSDWRLARTRSRCGRHLRTPSFPPPSPASGPGFLHDAVCDERACAAFLSFIEHGKQAPTRNGLIRGVPGAEFAASPRSRRDASGCAARLRGTEQYFAVLWRPAHPEAVSPPASRAESGLRNWKVPDGESPFRRHTAIRRRHRVRAGGRRAVRRWRCFRVWWQIRETAGR